MQKKNNEHVSTNKETATKKIIERLTIWDRFAAYRNIPRFFALTWRTSRSITLANCVLRTLQALLPLMVLRVGKLIIDEIVAITHNKVLSREVITFHIWPFDFHLSYLGKLVLLEFFLVILITVLSRIISLLDDLLGELLTNRTNVMIMSHAATLDLNQFEDSVFYDKLERARQQSSGRVLLLTQLFNQMQSFITMFSFIVILVAFNVWLIIMLIIFVLPAVFGSAYFNAKNYLLLRSQTTGRRELDYLNLVGSSDATAKEVRLFDLSTFFIKRYNNVAISLYKAKRKLGIRQSFVGAMLYIPGAIGFYIAFLYIVDQVVAGLLTLGGLTFLLGSIRQLGSIGEASAKRLKSIAQGAYFLRDFFDFFKIKPDISIQSNPRPFPKSLKMGFTFENVGYKYRNSDRWANRNLNFTLRPGEKLALVGENGAGKTTLVKLLTRLYDPTEGRILLEGYDLKEYDLTELRMQMGVIFQDFIRYQLTASENIAIGNIREADNKQLIKESANLSLADSIIDRLPKNYDQMLGHYFANGFELSGGEWQKIALARAYMRDAPIIILDEPTAALDARAEFDVFKRFSEMTENKTAVLISHRFSTVRMSDRIIVLDKGEILEIGTHEELLENKGRYEELFQLQATGYR